MAETQARRRPAVALIGLFVFIGLLFGVMGLTKSWTPRLGLDLRGGMSITLTATNSQVPPESLELAANIIQQRVDSLGVGEASVKTAGERYIIVSAPNVQSDELVELVGSTAQLAFRQVLAIDQAGKKGAKNSGSKPADSGKLLDVSQALAYKPTKQEIEGFQKWTCGADAPRQLEKATYACDDEQSMKFLLGPVALEGKMVKNAVATVPKDNVFWAVSLEFDGEGAKRLGQFTTALVKNPDGPTRQFAVVLDGVVESNARVNEPIPNGQALISGNFTQTSATKLANVLKFGSLPLTFDVSQVETVSPTLGGEQLRVGLIAGLVGLLLVTVYAFFYYRALGLVILGSLVVAAALTYSSMVLLGESVGFTMNLPAIAGAIVAIGLTADSFVIFFERIKDEIREGRSVRSAVYSGWQKARGTIVVSDLVSILSAVVLFFLAAGSVQGFAFMLGLTTVIDLLVVFFFTVPLIALLSRLSFFSQGHKLSGFDPARLGVTKESLVGRRSARRKAKEA